MADMDAGEQVGLTLRREQLFVFGADGQRLARGTQTAAPIRAQVAGAGV
jgi:hypothetical protein